AETFCLCFFYFVPFLIRFNYNTVMKLHILQLSFAHVTSKEFKSIRNGEVLKESTVKKLVKAKTISLSYIKETLSKHGVTFITDRKSTRLNSSHVSISYAV